MWHVPGKDYKVNRESAHSYFSFFVFKKQTNKQLPVSSKWGAACERWWLYWTSWTAASLIVWCKGSQLLVKTIKRGNFCRDDLWARWLPVWTKWFLTLLFGNRPHHEVHAGGVGLTAQFKRAQFTVEVLDIVQDPLQLRLAAAELLQHKVMNLLHKVCLKVWWTQKNSSLLFTVIF